MVNLDWCDMRLVKDVRDVLGNDSSTLLIANQDHAPELWTATFEYLVDFKTYMEFADRLFATTPTAQALMERMLDFKKKVYLSPHPCDTKALKHLRTTYQSDHLITFYHRYLPDYCVPAIVTRNFPIPVSLVGYIESSDPKKQRTIMSYDLIVNTLPFPDFCKLIKEARIGYDPFPSYSYGRVTCDTAALGLPVVGSNTLYSVQICYPLTGVNVYDFKTSRALLDRLYFDEGFYNEVQSIAYWNVEYFGFDACRNRFMAMLEDEDLNSPNQKDIRRGEIYD